MLCNCMQATQHNNARRNCFTHIEIVLIYFIRIASPVVFPDKDLEEGRLFQ